MNIFTALGRSQSRFYGSSQTIATGLVAMLLLACSDSGPRSPKSVATTPAEIMTTPEPRELSAAERQIIDELVSLFPKSESTIRALLSDKRVATMELPGARAQSLLARLEQIRSGRGTLDDASSANTPGLAATSVPESPPATVVLVSQLDDPTADVILVRRTNPSADMIVMSEKHASGARLGAGVAALFKLRTEFGDSSPRDMRLVVHGATMPHKWPHELKAEADRVVDQLRAKSKQHVRGLGEGRSVEIPMSATPR